MDRLGTLARRPRRAQWAELDRTELAALEAFPARVAPALSPQFPRYLKASYVGLMPHPR